MTPQGPSAAVVALQCHFGFRLRPCLRGVLQARKSTVSRSTTAAGTNHATWHPHRVARYLLMHAQSPLALSCSILYNKSTAPPRLQSGVVTMSMRLPDKEALAWTCASSKSTAVRYSTRVATPL